MIDVASILWPTAAAFAVWAARDVARQYLAARKPETDMAQVQAEISRVVVPLASQVGQMRQDLTKTARVASQASLAAGLREDPK